MALNANKMKAGGKQAPVIEPGNYMARVVQVIDLGMQPQRPYDGQAKAPGNEIRVTYELVDQFMLDGEGNPDTSAPRWVSETFVLFRLNQDKAKSTARYKALDPTLEHDGDWSMLVGKPCLVATYNKEKAGKTYCNVGAVSPPISGMAVAELANPEKAATFTLDDPDMVVYDNLPDWLKDIITSNLEYAGSPLAVALGGEGEETPSEPDSGTAYDDVPL
jgi:hypothetical protein